MIFLNTSLIFIDALLAYQFHQMGYSWTKGFGVKSLLVLAVILNVIAVVLTIVRAWG